VWHKLVSWLDDRTGYRSVAALPPRVLPEGPSWTATSGGCLFWMLVVQGLTGLALMTVYSPSVASGWASVYFLQQLPAGSFLRGMHYFGGQALPSDALGYENPSPRNMDTLVCRIVQDQASQSWWVEVEFEKFEYGIAAKIPRMSAGG
jgi:hypothetical protein